MITPGDVRDFAEKAGVDISNYTDDELEKIIEHVVAKIEKLVGCPIISREVTEVKPRIKSTIVTRYPVGSVSKVEIKFDDYIEVDKYEIMDDMAVIIGWDLPRPVTARITYNTREADQALVDRVLLRMSLSEIVQGDKWDYTYIEHPRSIKEGDVQVTYPTVTELVEDIQAAVDYDLSALKRQLLLMI